jgi:hypothetical protein
VAVAATTARIADDQIIASVNTLSNLLRMLYHAPATIRAISRCSMRSRFR